VPSEKVGAEFLTIILMASMLQIVNIVNRTETECEDVHLFHDRVL
jgi:hypothetical protein